MGLVGEMIYIPTRGSVKRFKLLSKAILSIQPYGLPIYLILHKKSDLGELGGVQGTETIFANHNQPMGTIRNIAIHDAAKRGYRSILLMDDDHSIRKGSDILGMLKFAERKDVVGVGAWKSIYGMFYVDKRGGLDRPTKLKIAAEKFKRQAFLTVSGNCFGVFALNIKDPLDFNPALNVLEDAELEMRTVGLGIPWYIYGGVHAISNANRYTAGGLDDHPVSRQTSLTIARNHMLKHWGEYVTLQSTDGRYRTKWAKLANDFLDIKTRPLADVNAGKEPFAWIGK